MNNQDHSTRRSAEDRAALREELKREEDTERLAVFEKLNEEADAPEADVPPMPEELRDRLVEQFGESEPQRTAKPAPAEPGIFERIAEFFREKPLAFGGTALAAAACVMLLFVAIQPGSDPTGTLRGGGDGPGTVVGDGVAVYIVTEGSAEAVLGALEDPDAVKVVTSAAALPETGAVVAVELEEGRLRIMRDGKTVDERSISDVPGEIVLELRAAIDEAARDE